VRELARTTTSTGFGGLALEYFAAAPFARALRWGGWTWEMTLSSRCLAKSSHVIMGLCLPPALCCVGRFPEEGRPLPLRLKDDLLTFRMLWHASPTCSASLLCSSRRQRRTSATSESLARTAIIGSVP